MPIKTPLFRSLCLMAVLSTAATANATPEITPTRTRFTLVDRPIFHLPAPVMYVVDEGYTGSSSTTFATISEALAAARAACASRVTIWLYEGTYDDFMGIDRPTEIYASGGGRPLLRGSVFLFGDHDLTLSGVDFRNPNGVAVMVYASSADVELLDVSIVGARHYGVWQRGGSLYARDLRIDGTLASSYAVAHGTAIVLGGGVQALIRDTTLRANAQGILIEDPDTVATLWDTDIEDSTGNADFISTLDGTYRGGQAAVEVRYGALLLTSDVALRRNRGYGLTAHDHARVSFYRSLVEDTWGWDHPTDPSRSLLGMNILATQGAVLDLSSVVSRDAPLGLYAVGAYVTVRHPFADAEPTVEISGCSLGLEYQAPPDDPTSGYGCLVNPGLRMVGNGGNIDVPMIDVSGVSADATIDEWLEQEQDGRICYHVRDY